MTSRTFFHFLSCAFLVGLFAVLAVPASAADVSAGAEKSQVCVACHGVNGNAPIADNPKLAGQARKYLLYAMRAYKDGSRKDPIMNAQLSAFSDEDLQDLSAYFAAQKSDLLP